MCVCVCVCGPSNFEGHDDGAVSLQVRIILRVLGEGGASFVGGCVVCVRSSVQTSKRVCVHACERASIMCACLRVGVCSGCMFTQKFLKITLALAHAHVSDS